MANDSHTQGQRGGSGNFAQDRERASEAGKKGGEHSHGGQHSHGKGSQSHQSGTESDMDKSRGGSESEMSESRGGSRGGSGNFADDREKASEAGKKGGEHSHSRTSHGGK